MDNQNLNNSEASSETKTPSLMRESVDQNGNVVNPSNNSEPDMADKTINAVEGFMDTEDHKSEFTLEEVKKYKTSSIICYLPIVPLYFVITSKFKQSKYLHFHSNQGLVVSIMWILSFFISEILSAVFSKNTMLRDSTPGWVSFISYLLYCICFLTTLYGIINTVNDSSKEIPLIGKIKLLK